MIKPWERLFFAVIGVAALFVAYLGLLVPARMDRVFTWADLPPLHARFVGVLYFFGALYMLGCVVARRAGQVRPAMAGIGLFTSLLLVVTLLNLEAFDFDLLPVWVWTLSYIVYPLIALTLALTWRGRDRDDAAPSGADALAPWARTFLLVQACVFAFLGAAALVAREAVVDAWPWPISAGLAQFYGGPFVAYAYCSWAYGRRGRWSEMSTVVPAMLTFTAGTVVVSLVHSELFSASDAVDWVWFGGFVVATAVLVAMGARVVSFARQ
ncbi:MAG: hypothetical protein M3R01_06625 [Actinomycetota bacterium]|nr:hypothetical protein [Actinomycetota bacterium]